MHWVELRFSYIRNTGKLSHGHLYYVATATRYSTAKNKWAAPWQNQHNGFATSMDTDQPAQFAWIHAVCLPTLLQVEKLIANSMDPDQTAWRRRLVWIHAGCKHIMLVLSWCGSNNYHHFLQNCCMLWPQFLCYMLQWWFG
jgi:hypothetical protein